MRTDSRHRTVIGVALVAALVGGLVSAVAAQTAAPYVKVLVDGTPVSFDQPPIIANSRVLVPLSAIGSGDAETITADPSGAAQTVQGAYTQVHRTVGSIGHDKITLRGGQTYSLLRLVSVTKAGLSVSPEGLQPGDEVTLRISPVTHVVYGIDAAETGTLPAISAVTLSPTGRALLTGDVMTVIATGPVHGTATFSIDGVRKGLPMREFIAQPGLYIGTYAIRPGDKVSNSSVVVSITAPTGQILTAAAPTEVSVNAATPRESAGAPVISSPTPGTGVRAPFTVSGTAPPGSLVKVRADYAGTGMAAGLRGTLGTQTVTADARGYWSVTVAARPPVQGTTVTISAVLVDSTGTARTPVTTVNTTLQ